MNFGYGPSPGILELLRIVIETRSVTATAERLRVSQPAVSKAVQQAEQKLGFPLFFRERGRLVPTLDARVLLPQNSKGDGGGRIRQPPGRGSTGVEDGYGDSGRDSGNTLGARAIARFHSKYAGVHVTIHTTFNEEIVDAVADHRVDIGLVLTPVEDRHTVGRDLCSAELVCVMPTGHPLAESTSIGPTEVAPYKLISFNRHQPIGTMIEDSFRFRAAGIRRVIAVEVNQSWTACSLVQCERRHHHR